MPSDQGLKEPAGSRDILQDPDSGFHEVDYVKTSLDNRHIGLEIIPILAPICRAEIGAWGRGPYHITTGDIIYPIDPF